MYSFKILQNWSRDLFHSSLLQFDRKCYLFNCSDATQRNAIDQGVKIHKLANIFYNSAHVDAYLGTYGIWMTRNEQITGQLIAHELNQKEKKIETKFENNKYITLWGPPGLRNNFKYCNSFFIRDKYNFVKEWSNKINLFEDGFGGGVSYFEDENLKIHPICIEDISKTDLSKSDYAMSYICEPHLKKPPFLPNKAMALGLKPGPNYALLQNGQSVFLENGKEIRPEDVLGKQSPSSCVGIFYSPTINHAFSLSTNELILNFQNSETRRFSLIVHIVKDISILESNFYKEFIERLGDGIIHIVDCKDTNFKFMLNESKHKVKVVLNKVESELFNNNFFTNEDTLPKVNLFSVFDPDFVKMYKIINSSPGFEYILYPIEKMKVVKEKIYHDPYIYKNAHFNAFTENLEKVISNLRQENKWLDYSYLKNSNSENSDLYHNSQNNITKMETYPNKNYLIDKEMEPEITFLGTTSMKPGKQRNVSAIMVKMPKYYNNNCLLMDCGEGTFSQIFEHYGNNYTNEILMKLKIIFISHKHGDHMLGLMKILAEIDAIKINMHIDPMSSSADIHNLIYIIAPSTILKWIRNSISSDIVYKKHIFLIDCSDLNPNPNSVYQKFIFQKNILNNFVDIEKIKSESELTEILEKFHYKINSEKQLKEFYDFSRKYLGLDLYSIEVFHCDESYGCVIEERNSNLELRKPWKISYSGDTRPCNNFFNFSYGSTVMIHEATFDDDLKEDAKEKMHSTFEEGISLGKEGNSWKTILTHFSPRYSKYITWNQNFMENKILLTHDFLTVKLSELDWAYFYAKNFNEVMNVVDPNDEQEEKLKSSVI